MGATRSALLLAASAAPAAGAVGGASGSRPSRRLAEAPAPAPWSGAACGSGRRRRLGGPALCDCMVLDNESCVDYHDNCCELGHPECCASECLPSDLACLPTSTSTASSTTSTTTTTGLDSWELLCPWARSSGVIGQFACADGSLCAGELCCASRGGRVRCPAGAPSMCSRRSCGAGDYCCSTDCRDLGGLRPCVQQLSLAAGTSHSLFVRSDGHTLATGFNTNGQLGVSSTRPSVTPIELPLTDVQAVAGSDHSLFLAANGSVWASGFNRHGQLGDGTFQRGLSPVLVFSGCVAVSAAPYHSVFLRHDGTAWAVGYNLYGRLGDGTTSDRLLPVQVLDKVRAISAGASHTLFLRLDGTALATGWNRYGQLGDNTTETRLRPVVVMSDIVAISAGNQHSVFLRSDGTAWATGHNSVGQLGDGTEEDRGLPAKVLSGVMAISAGASHTLFVKSDGSAWSVGSNTQGQLGDGSRQSRSVPVRVLNDTIAVAAGDTHSLFLKRDGFVWAVGENTAGQLGDGSMIDALIPKEIINIWPLPTTTTTSSTTTPLSTRTVLTTSRAREECSPNEFPIVDFTFSLNRLARLGDLFSSSQLYPVLGHERWNTEEVWTLSFRATSLDTEIRSFAFVGGRWFLTFAIPPGVRNQHIYVQDRIAYTGVDLRCEYVGPGYVGNITVWDVYLAPGVCTRPLDIDRLTFAYETGDWSECGARCGINGSQSRNVSCLGSDGQEYFDGWACQSEAVPPETRACTGECSGTYEERAATEDGVVIGLLVAVSAAAVCVAACACYSWRSSRRKRLGAIAPSRDTTPRSGAPSAASPSASAPGDAHSARGRAPTAGPAGASAPPNGSFFARGQGPRLAASASPQHADLGSDSSPVAPSPLR